MIKYGRKKRHAWFFGVTKCFQGFGVILCLDNPQQTLKYVLIEFRFMWLKIWYTYDLKHKHKSPQGVESHQGYVNKIDDSY